MTTAAATRPRSDVLAEWAGAFTGPVAWALHLGFNYALEEFLACAPGAHGSPIFLGLGVRQWVVASNVVLAAITLGAGLLSLARYRRLRGRDPSPGRVEEWMALAGIVLSALFFVIIAAGIAPAAILDACVQSP
ncbi:MAG TPA: hypothetical protein VII47_05985 [Actinomycetota bacterium]|jgi:hypothetical protein